MPQVFEEICLVFDRLHLDLFVTRANTKLPLCVTNSGSSSLEAGSSSSSVGPSVRSCLPPTCAATSGHHTGFGVGESVVGSRSSAAVSEGVVCGSAGFSRGRTPRHSVGFNPTRSTSHVEVSPKPHMEIVHRIIRKVGFSSIVASVAAADLRLSTTALYQSNYCTPVSLIGAFDRVSTRTRLLS